MNMLVKICGISRIEDALICAEAGADFLGFVFARSPRRIDIDAAKHIIKAIPENIPSVGVFLDQAIEEVVATVLTCGIDYIQLHGDETPDYCEEIHSRTGRGIIKAVTIGKDEDLELLRRYTLDSVSFLLLDSRVGDQRGGTGKPFPWEIVEDFDGTVKPIFIAGGLTCSNVKEAITRLRPIGVDVSSGVEKGTIPGVKDEAKVRRFVREAKTCAA
jgi:phosphoribosylanthranilate isomerase